MSPPPVDRPMVEERDAPARRLRGQGRLCRANAARSRLCGALLLAVLLTAAGPALAVSDDIDDTIEQIEQRSLGDTEAIPHPGVNVLDYIGTRLRLQQDFIAGTELETTKILSSRTRTSVELGAPLSKKAAIGFRLGAGVRAFRFDGPGDFIDTGRDAGEPVDELLESSFRTGVRVRLMGDFDLDAESRLGRLLDKLGALEHDEWEERQGKVDDVEDTDLHLIDSIDFEVVGAVRSQHEEGARFASGILGGGSITFRVRSSDRFDLRLGLGVGSTLDDNDLRLSPVIKLRVKVLEDVWIETEGVGGRIEIDAAKGLRIDLAGGLSGERYRLEDRRDPRRIIPARGDMKQGRVRQGSLRFSRAEVSAGVNWRITRQLRVMVSAGCVLEQEWVVIDSHGHKFDEEKTREPAASVGLSLDWRF